MAKPKRARSSRPASSSGDEASFSATVDRAGRVLVPAVLRKRFGLEPGTIMVLQGKAGEIITMRSQRAVIRGIQAYYRKLRKPGEELLSEELIRERHREAEREYGR